ncbi:hypothetical protein GGI24_004063, partial [Coemansia furcata]
EWYDGYYIGRFCGKYNPWSVSSFIQALCISLSRASSDKEVNIGAITKSTAKAYWVTTGAMRLINKFVKGYLNEISSITEDLIQEYQ